MKNNGSNLYKIIQGVNRIATGISIMHITQKADKSNRETKYKSESDNKDNDLSESTSVACFHQVSHHMKNETGRLNPYWILLYNQSTVHMFSNHALLSNIKDADKKINVYLSGGANHCSTTGTLKNIGEVCLHENGLANILSYLRSNTDTASHMMT